MGPWSLQLGAGEGPSHSASAALLPSAASRRCFPAPCRMLRVRGRRAHLGGLDILEPIPLIAPRVLDHLVLRMAPLLPSSQRPSPQSGGKKIVKGVGCRVLDVGLLSGVGHAVAFKGLFVGLFVGLFCGGSGPLMV